ncbi:MAG: RsmB/NOP family class I SAM-dependent RNA methyltransferase [Brevirhabdus sp.]
MTPAARISAAIEVLDLIGSGAPAEQALTNWARANRYAGSGDRAAIRDHVFDVIRRQRSCAAIGGGQTGRALMIGSLVQAGLEPGDFFSGARFAPEPLSADEQSRLAAPPGMDKATRLDLPDWAVALCERAFDDRMEAELVRLRDRAPAMLRVNMARTTRKSVQAALAHDGLEANPHSLSPSALELTGHPRKLKQTELFRDGLVELQDAASQAAVDMVPFEAGQSVLDYCAGGGGKTLAMAARGPGRFFAHDAQPARMADLPARAIRAGVEVSRLHQDALKAHAPFDVVICDVPCTGSGAWRRAPAGKWTLNPARMGDLVTLQASILDQAGVLSQSVLAYFTCSLFVEENEDQIEAFLSRSDGWHLLKQRRFAPSEGGDGFYAAILTR